MRNSIKVAAAAGALLLLAACAPTVGDTTSTEGSSSEETAVTGTAGDVFDITELCGDEEISVALTDGAAGHTWRKIVWAEFQAEAAKCDNITDVYYADAGNDPQKAAADISGFVSQGVDVIVTLADHGDAMIPSIREAYNAGVTIIPYYNSINGVAGTDFSDQIVVDTYANGAAMAEWMAEQVPSGNVIVLGGIAACTSCHEMYEGVVDTLEGTDLTVVGGDFIATDYSPETTERAVAGLLSQYGSIAGVITDYGVVAQSAMAAFEEAGQPLPAVALSSGQNSVYCGWAEAEAAGNGYPLAAWEKATQVVRSALRWGLADYYGVEWDEPKAVAFEQMVDTTGDMPAPECEPDSPDDKDMFSGLTEEEMEAAIG